MGGEEKENEEGIIDLPPAESLTILTTVSTAPATSDQSMHTPEFRIHFVEFVHVQTLMAFRVATKGWNAAADAQIDEGVRSGDLMVHGGKDISWRWQYPREERRKLVTRVIFLLNITKVGDYACAYAINLVVVDIPEGVGSIGLRAFKDCTSLTKVSFPTTLTSIGWYAFQSCSSLDNVVLRHTNLQELGSQAFAYCFELKSMTIPDSLQTLDTFVFYGCSKLVPSKIDVNDINNYDQDAVIAHLRSQQQQQTQT